MVSFISTPSPSEKESMPCAVSVTLVDVDVVGACPLGSTSNLAPPRLKMPIHISW